jgi:hypothetical protein
VTGLTHPGVTGRLQSPRGPQSCDTNTWVWRMAANADAAMSMSTAAVILDIT